jgi:hypothetical protein
VTPLASAASRRRRGYVRGRIHALVQDAHDLDRGRLPAPEIDDVYWLMDIASAPCIPQLEAAQSDAEQAAISRHGTFRVGCDRAKSSFQESEVARLAILPPPPEAHRQVDTRWNRAAKLAMTVDQCARRGLRPGRVNDFK